MRIPGVLFTISALLIVLSVLPEKSSAIDEGYADAYSQLQLGNPDKAIDILNRKISSDDKDVVALSLLGDAYRRKRDYSNSLRALNKAISIDNMYPMPYFYKGKLYYSMQRFEDIPGEFSIFMEKIKPGMTESKEMEIYISYLHEIAYIYFEIKNYDEALNVLNKILTISPKDQTAMYNLGLYYYRYERNRQRAYSSFMKTIEVDPTSGIAKKARYAIEFIRTNPDARIEADFSFIDKE